MAYDKRFKLILKRCVLFFMIVSAILTLFVVGSFPLVKATMITYQTRYAHCKTCIPPLKCSVNGTLLGEEFTHVDNFYTLPVASAAFVINFMLAMRILGSRFINLHCTTFFFFCVVVFPVRFLFLAMQTLEFTRIGGDSYTLLIYYPEQFSCELFSGNVDAVFLLHLRFFLLVLDFVTFHILIVCVPLFYVDDKIDRKSVHFEEDSEFDTYTKAGIIFHSGV